MTSLSDRFILIDEDGSPVPAAIVYEKRPKLIAYKGKTKTLTQWAKTVGMERKRLFARIYYLRWDIDKAMRTPSRRKIKRVKAR